MQDLYLRVRKLMQEFHLKDIGVSDVLLLYKNAILDEKKSLKDAGIDQNTKINVIYSTDDSSINEREESAPLIYRPKSPKDNYFTHPSFKDIQNMSVK